MIKLKIEATDGADLRRQLAALLGTTAAVVTDPVMPEIKATEEAEAEKPAATRSPRKPKAEPAKDLEGNAEPTTTTTEKPGETSPTTSETEPPSDEVTIEDIREMTLKVVDKCGKAGIEAVLEQFGVARATQVPEERRAELRDALQDALDAAVAA